VSGLRLTIIVDVRNRYGESLTTKRIQLSSRIYELLQQQAEERKRSPDELAEELPARQLLPEHPYIDISLSRSGPRPVIKGTHIPVSVVVGYVRLGHEPEAIVRGLLPQLNLAQVYDALSYCYDHREEIETELAEDAETVWRVKGRPR